MSVITADNFCCSALSLRIFGDDITTIAREASAAKKQRDQAVAVASTETPIAEDEKAESTDQAEVDAGDLEEDQM